jgi:hypothetical protein
MLAEVRRVWIDGYLKDSLHNLLRIELGLQEKPDALGRPWDLIVQRPDREPRPLPPGRSMAAVFDEMGRRLLILGAPGSGKTTLLLELADHLLDLAKHDEKHPIPVVFHLSTWAARRQPLKDWLVDELWKRYDVARKIGQAWVNGERILPLLDGLDEVAPEHREACVEAINAFRREHPLVAFAVCSRAAEYEELRVRLELSGAVLIRPLSREQIGAYLKEAGKSLAGVRTVLRDDETVWDLLETPLMLSIVALTYQGRSASEIRATGTLEQRRTDLFANYTERMFERRCKVTAYTREQTVRWLTWLARSMIKNNLSVFYLEWMQPDWLAFRGQRWLLVMAASMCTGLAYGLIVLLPILISLLTRDALFVELVAFRRTDVCTGLGMCLCAALWRRRQTGCYRSHGSIDCPTERGNPSLLARWLGIGYNCAAHCGRYQAAGFRTASYSARRRRAGSGGVGVGLSGGAYADGLGDSPTSLSSKTTR